MWGMCVAGMSGAALAQDSKLDAPAAAVPMGTNSDAIRHYDDGKEHFKSGRYFDAMKELEAAYRIMQNEYIEYYLAQTYDRLGRYDDAISFYNKLAGRLGPEQERDRQARLARCRIGKVRAAVDAGLCDEANRNLAELPLGMESKGRAELQGSCEIRAAQDLANRGGCEDASRLLSSIRFNLSRPLAKQKEELERFCGQELMGFKPTTASQRAAFVLFNRGRKLFYEGRFVEAQKPFQNALNIYDEPHIRLYSHRAYMGDFDCRAAQDVVATVLTALDRYADELQADETWCAKYYMEPKDVPEGVDRIALMTQYRVAHRLVREGKTDMAAQLLEKTLTIFERGDIRLAAARFYLQAKRYREAEVVLSQGSSLSGDAKALLARVRFLVRDENTDTDREQRYSKFEEALQAGRSGDGVKAAALLGALQENPYARLEMARRGLSAGEWEKALHAFISVENKIPEAQDEIARGKATCSEQIARAVATRERLRLARERPVEPPKRSVALPWSLMGTGIGGVAASGLFFYFYYNCRDRHDGAMKDYRIAVTPAEAERLRKKADDARREAKIWSTVGYVSAGVGTGLIVTGVILLVTGKEPAEDAQGLSVVPIQGGGAVSWSMSY